MINFIRQELRHFQKLSQNARTLAVSYVLAGAAYPLVGIYRR